MSFKQIKSPEEIKALVNRYLQSEKEAKEVVMETVDVDNMFKRQIERQTKPIEEVKGNIKDLETQLKALPQDIQQKFLELGLDKELLQPQLPEPAQDSPAGSQPLSNIITNLDDYEISDDDIDYINNLRGGKYSNLSSLKEFMDQAALNWASFDESKRVGKVDLIIQNGQSEIFGEPITFAIESENNIKAQFGQLTIQLTKGLIILIIDPIFSEQIYDKYVTKDDADIFYSMGYEYMGDKGRKPKKWKYVVALITENINVDSTEPKVEEPSPIKGKGYKKWNPYKMKIVQGQGLMGNIQIDLPNLQKGRVVARLGGSVLMDKKIDKTFIDLLTKRYNPKGLYTPKAIKTFKELVTKSGLPIEGYSKKLQILFPEVMPPKEGGEIRFVSSLDELVERMNVLLGAIHAGNNGSAIKNEVKQILDILLNNNVVTKKFHQNIYSTYLK